MTHEGEARSAVRVRPPPGGKRYRMVIEYDGTNFHGWQCQPNQSSIQGELERSLKQLTRETVRVHSCGRTDAGVHARAQTAHFDLAKPWPAEQLKKALNALLPDSIAITLLKPASATFHARYDAKGKEYRYTIWNAQVPSPLLRHQAVHIYVPLDVAAMRAAAARLTGTRDFAAFSANPHREIGGTVRTLWRLDVRKTGNTIVISALGDGFLYKMVRSLAGHLLSVGRGLVPVEETDAILARGIRTARVETAPAHGLCLHKIYYTRLPKRAGLC